MEKKSKIKVIYTDEVIEFLSKLPLPARKKISFNIKKVEEGIIAKASEVRKEWFNEKNK